MESLISGNPDPTVSLLIQHLYPYPSLYYYHIISSIISITYLYSISFSLQVYTPVQNIFLVWKGALLLLKDFMLILVVFVKILGGRL